MVIDIHTHTYPASDDSTLSPDELIQAAKRAGLDGVCLTDHDRFWKPDEVELLSTAHDFLVIPGCEITTEEGHLLVYGPSRYVFGMHKAEFICARVKDAGGAMVVAHPYRRNYTEEAASDPAACARMLSRACQGSAIAQADAIEVVNGRGSEQENSFALDIAERTGRSGTGASDSHRAEDMGTAATRFERPVRGLADFVRELKAGRFSAVTL